MFFILSSLTKSIGMNFFIHYPYNLRLSNVIKVAIGNLNINSLPKKFNRLNDLILKYVDILVLTETKLDDFFQIRSF